MMFSRTTPLRNFEALNHKIFRNGIKPPTRVILLSWLENMPPNQFVVSCGSIYLTTLGVISWSEKHKNRQDYT
jgi:hypothetical protein